VFQPGEGEAHPGEAAKGEAAPPPPPLTLHPTPFISQDNLGHCTFLLPPVVHTASTIRRGSSRLHLNTGEERRVLGVIQ